MSAAPSPWSALQVERLAGALGAEVHGIDLARPLDTATRQALHEATCIRCSR